MRKSKLKLCPKQTNNMTNYYFVFICIIVFVFNFARLNAINNKNEIKCSKYLAKTINRPESCAYQYLNRLRKEFLVGCQLLFTPQASSFVISFEIKYQVSVALVDAMGYTTFYNSNGTKQPASPSQYPDIAQAYLNFPGFIRETKENSEGFYFSFIVYSVDAQMYTVTLSMPLSKDPISC